jgi:hypothetical protein
VRKLLDNAITDLKQHGTYEEARSRGEKRAADGTSKSFLAEENARAVASGCELQNVVASAADPHGQYMQPAGDEGLRNPEEVKDEITKYAIMPSIDMARDPLLWWRENRHQFPGLASLAMWFLSVPATSAAVERLFSATGLTITDLRSCLSSTSLEQLVFLRKNWSDDFLQVNYHVPRNLEEEKKEEEKEDSEGEEDYTQEGEEEILPEIEEDFDDLINMLADDDALVDEDAFFEFLSL